MTSFPRPTHLCALALAAASGCAHADAPSRRAELQRDFVQAQYDGALPSGFAALAPRQLYWGNAQNAGQLGRETSSTQVRDDLLAARRAGDVRTSFLGWTQQELARGGAGADSSATTTSRAAVHAARVRAQSTAALPVGFVGRSLRALYPGQYPTLEPTYDPAQPGKQLSWSELK